MLKNVLSFGRKRGKAMVPKVGQPAADAVLKSHLGQTIRLADYRGKCNVVLVFFPLAWTPV